MIRATAGASTHTGQVRKGNEDSYAVIDGLYVVADGMGGHSAGEVASAIAVKTLQDIYTKSGNGPGMSSPEQVAEAISTANMAIFQESLEDTEKSGMGTTLTAVIVTDAERNQIVIGNIGDSRTYLWRDDELRQITVDHSHVQALVDRGAITAAEAKYHFQRNIVLRALGIDSDIEIDLFPLEVRTGDRFILCSDGLVDEAEDSEIENETRLLKDPQELADSLVRLANDHGGRDNITVVVVDFIATDVDGQSPTTQEIPVLVPAQSPQASSLSATTQRTRILAIAGAALALIALLATLIATL